MKFNQEQLETLIEALNQKNLSIDVEISKLYAEQDNICEERDALQKQLDEILYKDYDIKENTWYISENKDPWPHDTLLTIVKVQTVLENYLNCVYYCKRRDDGDVSFRVTYGKDFKSTFIRYLNDGDFKSIEEKDAKDIILDLVKL